jgi:hypothetical protein
VCGRGGYSAGIVSRFGQGSVQVGGRELGGYFGLYAFWKPLPAL